MTSAERPILVQIEIEKGHALIWLHDILRIETSRRDDGTLIILRPTLTFSDNIPDIFFIYSPLPFERVMRRLQEAAHATR
jgi:hypothetical protein